MKFIDLSKLELPDGWQDDATIALNEVRKVYNGSIASGDNAEVVQSKVNAKIDEFSYLWRDKKLKEALKLLSNDRCWYSECSLEGHEIDVDHFRPKGAINGVTGPAYWWRAFSPENYRLSCVFCNRWHNDEKIGKTKGGKADEFDLVEPRHRIRNEKDDDLIATDEFPLLLDPCLKTDINLLWFKDGGEAFALDELSDRDKNRVNYTIDVYHLKVFDSGRGAAISKVKNLIALGNDIWDSPAYNPQSREQAIESIKGQIRALCAWEESYTAASICAVRGGESKQYPWTRDILGQRP